MFLALHECEHVSMWRTEPSAPRAGEHITCGTCGVATRVRELFGPWRVQCLDCHRVNGHATLEKTVTNTAIRHAQEWSTHRVRVWRYGDRASVHVVTSKDVGVQAALFTDAPF